MNIGPPRRNNGKLKTLRGPPAALLRRSNSAGSGAGFGLSPPPRRQSSFRKQPQPLGTSASSSSVQPEKSCSSGTKAAPPQQQLLLREAEAMVRVVLQNPTATLSADSIHRAVTQLSTAQQTKHGNTAVLDSAEQLVRVALDQPDAPLTTESLRQTMQYVQSLQKETATTTRSRKQQRNSSEATTAQQQLLEDAQRLVRLLLGKPSEMLSSSSIHKAMEHVSAQQTSKRYRFLLEKPWRTTTNAGYDDSSHTADFFSEHNESPQRRLGSKAHSSLGLTTSTSAATSDLLVDQLSQTQQALEQARSRIRRLEEREAKSAVPSNESLGSIGDVVALSGGGDSSSESNNNGFLVAKVAKLEAQLEEVAQEHQIEVQSLQQQLKKSVQQLEDATESFGTQLAGVQLDHKVKVSSLERKLVDADRSLQEATKQLDYAEKNLAQTELDRRLKVSSLEKKIERMTQEQTEATHSAELEATVKRLHEQLAQLETERNDLVATNASDLSRAQENHEAEIASLESKLHVVSGLAEQVEAKDERIRTLEQAVAGASARHSEDQISSQESIAALNAELESWKQQATRSQEADARTLVLESEAVTSSARLADSEEAVSRLKERVADLVTENKLLSTQVKESEKRLQELMVEAAKSRGIIDCSGSATGSVASETRLNVGELWERLNDAETRLKVTSTTQEASQEVKTGSSSANQELATARSRVDEYLGKLKEMEQQNVELTRQTNTLQEGRDVLRDCLHRAKHSISELKMIVSMQEGNVDVSTSSQQQLDGNDEDIASQVTEQLRDLRGCLETTRRNLTAENASVGKELTEARDETLMLRHQLEIQKSRITDIQLEMEALRKAVDGSTKRFREKEIAFELQTTELTNSVDALRVELENKEMQLQETTIKADIAVTDSSSKVAVLEKLLADTEERYESVEEDLRVSEAKCARLEEATEKLKTKRRELQTKATELESLQSTAASLENEKRELHNRSLSLERDLLDSKERINQLQIEATSVPMMSEELSRVKVSLHDTTVALKKTEETNFEFQQKVASLMNQRDQSDERINQMEQTVKQLKGENDVLQRNLSDLESAQAREQELLSSELRESETTIISLLEELEQLKPLAGDLERAENALEMAEASTIRFENQIKEMSRTHEQRVSMMESNLSASKEEIEQLRDELLPLTRELQQANRQLAEVRNQTNALANGGEADSGLVGSLGLLQEDVIALRTELSDSGEALVRAEARNLELTTKHQGEISKLTSELLLISDECDQLRNEVNNLKPKLVVADCHAAENTALKLEAEEKEKQLISCRLQLQAMEEEQNYSRARIAELSDLSLSKNNPDRTLREKANECANLRAERDTLRQKLSVVEAMATALEEDNKQKKLFFQQLMSKNGSPEDTAEAFIESLQKELERTLKRCADLSLQLADSQFRITELTESIRRLKKAPPPHTQSNSLGGGSFHFGRTQSFESPKGRQRRSISSILTNSMAAMDESLRGAAGSANR